MNTRFIGTGLFFKGLLVIIIFSSLIILLVMLSLQEKENFTEHFIKPQSYSNFVINDEVYFTFGITNKEKAAQNYTVQFVADQDLISSEQVYVEKDQTIEFERKILIDDKKRSFPFKFRIIVLTPSGTESTFFWVKGKKIS